MSFVVTVKADTRAAEGGVDRLQRKLQRLENQTVRGRDAMGRFTSGGAKGMDAVRASTDRASTSMSKASNAAGGLRGQIQALVAAAGAYAGITRSIAAIDAYTSIGNRLNTIAKDQNNLNGLMSESLAVANETRSAWGSTAEAIVRMSGATKSLGTSQQEVIDFTSSLNKAIILSGAASSEASNGIIQLSQGLASGALRGDELRSVLENLPTVADVIAKGVGKTRGELRKMGEEGKITAEVVLAAFQKAAPEINEAFAKSTPTIAQGFTILKNEATKFFGEAGKGSGITSALGAAMGFLAENFTTIAKVAVGVAQALLGLYVIEKIIVLTKALTVAIAANPLGALLVGLTVGIALLRQFGDSLSAGAGHAAKVGDVLRVLWQDLKALAGTVVDFVENAWSKLTGAFSDGLDGTGIEFSLKSVLMFIASFVDAAIGMFKFLGNSVITVFGGIPAFLGEVFIKLAQDIAKVFEGIVNTVIDAYNALQSLVAKPINTVGAAVIGSEYNKQINAVLAREVAAGRVSGKTGASGGYHPSDLTNPAAQAEVTRLVAERDAARQRQLDSSAGQLKRVDFSFNNPLEGSGEAIGKKFAADWKSAVETSITKDYVASVFGRADDAALGRKAAGPAGYVSDARGKKDPTAPTKEAEAAAKRLTKELEALTKQSNPLVEAEMKFAHAVDVTGRALDAKRISVDGANTILSDLATQLRDARFPFEAWVTQVRAETDALSMSTNERERANEIRRVENDLRAKGLELGADIRADIEREIDAMRSAASAAQIRDERQRELQSTLERIRGPADEYNRGLSVAQELMRDNAITAIEYQRELERLAEAYQGATDIGNTLGDGLRRGWESSFKQLTDVAGAAEDVVKGAVGGMEDAFVSLVTTGKANFKGLIDSMLADLARLLFREAFGGVIGALTGGGGGLGGALERISDGGPGHATGGSWMVRGSGGTDSVPVSFRASPGERVTVATPSEQARSEGGGGNGRVQVRVVNVLDPSEIVSAMNSAAGEELILNTIRRHGAGKMAGRRG